MRNRCCRVYTGRSKLYKAKTSAVDAVTVRDVISTFVRQEGAEVDAKTTTGVTALWLAAGEGRKTVATDLIAKGSDVNNRRTDGITAVMAAAVGGHKV